MTNLSTVLMESEEASATAPPETNDAEREDVCLVSDSPHYAVRVGVQSYSESLYRPHPSLRLLAREMCKNSSVSCKSVRLH